MSAWLAFLEGDSSRARSCWLRAEAYFERFTPPWQEEFYVELFEMRKRLKPSKQEIQAAAEDIWGKPEEAPRVMARKPEFIPKPKSFFESLYLRSGPASLGELREFCRKHRLPLPWYYRVHRREAEDDEFARFVPYRLAKHLGEFLDEELPDCLRWKGLPDHPAWKVEIPEKPPYGVGENPDLAQIRKTDETFLGLRKRIEKATGDDNRALCVEILCCERISAIDKWRAVDAVIRNGGIGLSPETRRLIQVAVSKPLPPSPGLAARLSMDWRSVAFLFGDWDAPPAGLWMRPETANEPEEFLRIAGMGAVGGLARTEDFQRPLLVPDSFAWADVLVWPGRMFDTHIYAEEAPSWQ